MPKYIATIGVDFGVRSVIIEDVEVKVNFWDLSGHPEFFDVRNEFYKDAQGALLVYDVGVRRSFEALDGWLQVRMCCTALSQPAILSSTCLSGGCQVWRQAHESGRVCEQNRLTETSGVRQGWTGLGGCKRIFIL